MPTSTRSILLADAAALGIGISGTRSGRFALPQGKKLTGVSITIAGAAQGPIRANAVIAPHGENDLAHVLGDPTWVRADSGFGFRGGFRWDGEYPTSLMGAKDALLAVVRNDSGEAVLVRVSWSWFR